MSGGAGAPLRTQPLRTPGIGYRELFDAIDQGFCLIEVIFDGARAVDYRFLEVNASFEAQTGLVDAVGRTMRSLRANHEQHWFDIYGDIALTGIPRRFENSAAALGRWYDVYAFRVGAPEQRMVAILFKDITDRKRDQERLALAHSETDHRARNLVTLVMSMAQITRADTVPEYRAKLIGRLGALARSQNRLSERNRAAADLRTVVEEELTGHVGMEDARATCEGPSVALDGATAQCTAMTLHELATNATKYGSLSAPSGRVAVTWRRSDDGRLALRWAESGGPAVTPPTREGTGSKVMDRCIRDQSGGNIVFDWRRDGLVCELTIPLPSEPTHDA